jgi:hypothetical protein
MWETIPTEIHRRYTLHFLTMKIKSRHGHICTAKSQSLDLSLNGTSNVPRMRKVVLDMSQPHLDLDLDIHHLRNPRCAKASITRSTHRYRAVLLELSVVTSSPSAPSWSSRRVKPWPDSQTSPASSISVTSFVQSPSERACGIMSECSITCLMSFPRITSAVSFSPVQTTDKPVTGGSGLARSSGSSTKLLA